MLLLYTKESGKVSLRGNILGSLPGRKKASEKKCSRWKEQETLRSGGRSTPEGWHHRGGLM